LADQLISKQPSENAYFSRDKHNVGKIHEGIEYGVPFRKQWKELQKKIYKFHDEKELLIVTDITNYYDSIYLPELRKVFLSQISAPEVIVDLLFQIIEAISWKPDYLPYSGRGLPTTNLEAIRLLAHSFLFEIDEILKKETNNSFVRWMDDFTIGVNTSKEAISILCAISDMLKSRGLALNIPKTAILNAKKVEHEFLINKNMELDSFEKNEIKDIKQIEKVLYKKFNIHLREKNSRYWEKVCIFRRLL
jgi:Reverse transcriptase (RNA-dependent DNA polymerase).